MANTFNIRRSMGLKLLMVCALAVIMSIPAFMVFGLIYDRTSRAEQVVEEVGERYGGRQTFVGPVVIAPWSAVRQVNGSDGKLSTSVESGWYAVFAKTGQSDITLDTDVKTRGTSDLFKVRTYTANVAFNAAFDIPATPLALPQGAKVDWNAAAVLIGVGDPRGTVSSAIVTLNADTPLPLEPGSAYQQVFESGNVQWLAANPKGAIAQGKTFTLASNLQFTGVEAVSATAFARDTQITISGDWPHVGYHDEFAPKTQTSDAKGFKATWTIPFVARGLAEAGVADQLSGITDRGVQVRLVDPANPYQAVTRALKYAIMFLGVVFLAYFLIEVMSGVRVHPAQYVLVGLAQLTFYLLLLSIAERTGFDLAFVVAASATVALIGWYAAAVFSSRKRGLAATAVFALLYAFIYLLMRLDDFALLVGAVTSFLAIFAVMWFTRRINWYGLNEADANAQPTRPA